MLLAIRPAPKKKKKQIKTASLSEGVRFGK